MHRLSVVSLTALLVVGGVLAFVVFVNPQASASPPAPAGMQTHPTTAQITTQTTGTNSSLLTQPPSSNGTGSDDGTGFDS